MNKITLPAEIQEQALKVSEEKQKEVFKVLTDIFNGTSNWEKQVDAIEIKDVNDIMNISLADTARKNAKTARLNAEKIFDAKRSEVQLKMLDYKLEDSLWLKSKQIMQLKFKHIEEKAKFKSEFAKRYKAEQKELQTELRFEKVLKFKSDVEKSEVEELSNEVFDMYLSGLEKEYNERIEFERKAEAEKIRKQKEFESEQLRIKAENERLKKEAKEKEAERISEEKKRKVKEEKERKERELKEAKEREIYDAKIKKEREEKERIQKIEKEKREKLERELKAKEEKEEAERVRLINEGIAIKKAEKAAKLAPDKEKLTILAKQIESFQVPVLKSDEANNILANAVTLLNKTSKYINDNVNKI